MIYFVDEDYSAFGAWVVELQLRNLEVSCIWNADDAFQQLHDAPMDSVDLVIIDVMLAVREADNQRFSVKRTDEYLETGLCLLDDLVKSNPNVFPKRAVLLTNTIRRSTIRAAQSRSNKLHVPLWLKSQIDSPVEFGDRVVALVNGSAR
jgi:hypothetical protein